MKLLRAEIHNYRSIRDVTLSFDPPCRILVGLNESGKSNVLHALAHLDPDMEVEDDDLRVFGRDEDHAQNAYIRFVFGFDLDDLARLFVKTQALILGDVTELECLCKGGANQSIIQYCENINGGLYQIDIRKKSKGARYWSPAKNWSALPGLVRCEKAMIGATAVVLNEKSVSLATFKLARADFEGIPEGLPVATIEDITGLVSAQIVEFVEENLPNLVWWKYSENNLLPTRIPLDGFSANPSSCLPLRQMFILAKFDDPGAAIEDAKKRSNGIEILFEKVATATTKHMRQVWQEMKGVSVQLRHNGVNIECRLRDSQFAYDFAQRSDGFKRFFTFLLTVSMRVKTKDMRNSVYLHDEPEIGLHPSGARYLRDELIQISKDNFVVFSTHSTHMIDKTLPHRHLIVRKTDEVTEVVHAEQAAITEEEVLFQALGTSVFDDLKAKNIVFEGWRDFHLFRIMMKGKPQLNKDKKAALNEVGACYADGLKDVGNIASLLCAANRSCLIVSDGDKAGKDRQKHYEGFGQWLRYDEGGDGVPPVFEPLAMRVFCGFGLLVG